MTAAATHAAQVDLAVLLAARVASARLRRIETLFPDDGPRARHLYPKQLRFFALGRQVPTRCFMAANRTGKSITGAYETSGHLTGQYPSWWEGRRFPRPVRWWASGRTLEKSRDIVQRMLLGPRDAPGTGLIPGAAIVDIHYRSNTNGAADFARIRHSSGGFSELAIKSYDQGSGAYEGEEKDGIWNDEEPPQPIRAECSMRLATTHGVLIETFTPLKGLTPVVLSYISEDDIDRRESVQGDRAIVMAGWDDIPHLTAAAKARLLADCEPYLVEARSTGKPSLGSGAIYPVGEDTLFVDDLVPPPSWPRVYGLDVGWNRTAAVWGALDRSTDTLYLYAEHYQGQAEPSTHAAALRARGTAIPGVIDPAARGRSQHDGQRLIDIYRDLGLTLTPAQNDVEAGLYSVWERMATGRLKVCRSLSHWRAEWRLYRRDEKGHVVKERDHLMDAMRYLVMSGLHVAKVEVAPPPVLRERRYRMGADPNSWMRG